MKSYIYIESLVFDVTVLFIAFEISYRFNVFFFFLSKRSNISNRISVDEKKRD